MLHEQRELYTKLTGEDANNISIGYLGAYLDGYERGKADLVDNFKDIQAEIRRFMYDVNPSSSESDYACNYMIDIIQQKINELKEDENEV